MYDMYPWDKSAPAGSAPPVPVPVVPVPVAPAPVEPAVRAVQFALDRRDTGGAPAGQPTPSAARQ